MTTLLKYAVQFVNVGFCGSGFGFMIFDSLGSLGVVEGMGAGRGFGRAFFALRSSRLRWISVLGFLAFSAEVLGMPRPIARVIVLM